MGGFLQHKTQRMADILFELFDGAEGRRPMAGQLGHQPLTCRRQMDLALARIGATLAVIGVTVGELVGGNTGLGYLITFGEGQANTAMVFNAIVLLTLIGIVLYGVVAMIEARVLHYIPRAMR